MAIVLRSDKTASASIGNLFGVLGPSDYTAWLDFERGTYRVKSGVQRVSRDLVEAIVSDRASASTVRNAAGAMVDVPQNLPRIHHSLSGRTGLLSEPTRTNYLLNSAAPVTQSVTLTAGTYILSVGGTGSAAATGDVTTGNGVAATEGYPVVVVVAAPGAVTVTKTGALSWFQLENNSGGLFATTLIKTASVAVQRVRDLNKLAPTAFAEAVGQIEGSIITSFIPRAPIGGDTTGIGDRFVTRLGKSGSASGSILLRHMTTGAVTMSVADDANTSQMSANPPGVTFNPLTVTEAYKANDCVVRVGTGTPFIDTSVTLPTALDQLEIGSSQYSVSPIGLVTRILIYNRRLSAGEIDAVARQPA